MSSNWAVRCVGLSKRYQLGIRAEPYYTLRDSLARVATWPMRAFKNRRRELDARGELWALKDVSFDVPAGDVVGIIGRNGAGKSTLLKILSRITEPTSGYAELRGRVASLLEVGTGFHPELTGRENILLNGAILGMRASEIRRGFDEIVSFAEVERFVDTPVKHYSSGMYLRLAFAVAAHLQPEILFIDEVLAVGDASFQRKCLGKMGDVSRAGRTVFFVSHNMSAVQSLCKRVIWLDRGTVARDGQTAAVVTEYMRAASTSTAARSWSEQASAPGNDKIRVASVRLYTDDGTAIDAMTIRTGFTIEIEYWNLVPNTRLNLSLALFNQEGLQVLATTTLQDPNWHGKQFPVGLFTSRCKIPGDLLNDGLYRTELLFVKDSAIGLYKLDELISFELHDDPSSRGDYFGAWPGVIRPRLDWETTHSSSSDERQASNG
ncbi:MAG TPA: ABC transporter ATP-binding protein [Polyangiaceae bacterium]|nr:ABC transporter ATP-binding protein [Polyangiaceae bacterium]